jgi:serine/threonine protein kinase
VIAGRYSLDREIGRGGMGSVWLGRDELLGRQVALKRIGLLPGADSTDLARAEREARLTARLNHPHVVAVFDLVVDTATDARWLVMEYVEGTTLAQHVRREGRLSPDGAAPLMHQAADALVAAHAAGIVHRDVKPSNIMIDRRGRVKLADFGIARVAADPSLTQTGLVTGSPAYLAPEVASGHRGDEAVDVWSLGATLFFVLSGRAPYEIGDNLLGGLYRIVNEEPPRLPEAGWMAPLLEGTMVKDPARRWSMARVRDFLAEPGASATPAPAGSTRPVPAPPAEETAPTSSSPAARSRRLSPAAKAGLLVGLALSLVLALVLFVVLPDRGRAPDAVADGAPASPSASPTESGSSDATTPSQDAPPPAPTARGMESFIRDYVAAVGSDPRAAWQMLSPKFQRESGGFDTYRSFWSGVGTGQVLDVSADPRTLVVTYRVRFDNFGTGRRPTVLDLVFDRGRYLINGERTEGFVPSG